jgi:hypothetical protein
MPVKPEPISIAKSSFPSALPSATIAETTSLPSTNAFYPHHPAISSGFPNFAFNTAFASSYSPRLAVSAPSLTVCSSLLPSKLVTVLFRTLQVHANVVFILLPNAFSHAPAP